MTWQEVDVDLESIINAKRQRLQHRQEKTPMSAVVALAGMQAMPQPFLNIVTSGKHVTLIGQIIHQEAYDPVATALNYVRNGVDAITLFTDERVYTKGMEDLLLVARGARRCPVIAQDYILSEYHLLETRSVGASGVVVYASVLDRGEVRRVISLAQRSQMTTIVQVDGLQDIDVVMELSPHVVAVGNQPHFDIEHDMPILQDLREALPYFTKLMPLGAVDTLAEANTLIEQGVDAITISEAMLKNKAEFDQLRLKLEFHSEW